jgi:hypothetical protein
MPAKKKSALKRAAKKAPLEKAVASKDMALFDRVASILEQARGNVVRAVNTNMVLAYWLIGREIVQEIQGGKGRAAYGKQVIANLAQQLTEKYGQGFSVTNLQNFRRFHQAYAQRLSQIQHPLGVKSAPTETTTTIPRPPGAELATSSGKGYLRGSELITVFSPPLSWSHYRALMRVEKNDAREFYEQEANAGGWDKYMLYLPTEQELREEVERERRLIEAHAETVATRSKARKADRP